ncbi:non-ribosomal peptide synthetase [Anopheles sinensis]|uniref:Non-ribosomal peptide synthetase n=1 Tax=Anopheles sinensis TaxID=74873 RepID=A0A084VTF7_ANOSI|nr:non-ribosomal peptide synthetase [Anopheles sinensis]
MAEPSTDPSQFCTGQRENGRTRLVSLSRKVFAKRNAIRESLSSFGVKALAGRVG